MNTLTSLYLLLKFLAMATQVVSDAIYKAAERKKAGNLLEIQAAVSELKTATTSEERDEAARKIQAAFESR